MAKKNQSLSILQQMEEGTREIYSRYEKLLQNAAAGYEKQKKEIQSDYAAAANEASARSKIDLKNTLEQMADGGYVKSGETVHATIAGNAARNKALSALEIQKAKDLSQLETEKSQTEASLSATAEKEVGEYREKMLDRQWEEEQAQRKQELELAKQKAQSTTQEKEDGITPKKSAYDYVADIVEDNTKYYPKKGYNVIDRKGILKALTLVIRDENLSYRYRYEMYLYAKSLGYIEA